MKNQLLFSFFCCRSGACNVKMIIVKSHDYHLGQFNLNELNSIFANKKSSLFKMKLGNANINFNHLIVVRIFFWLSDLLWEPEFRWQNPDCYIRQTGWGNPFLKCIWAALHPAKIWFLLRANPDFGAARSKWRCVAFWPALVPFLSPGPDPHPESRGSGPARMRKRRPIMKSVLHIGLGFLVFAPNFPKLCVDFAPVWAMCPPVWPPSLTHIKLNDLRRPFPAKSDSPDGKSVLFVPQEMLYSTFVPSQKTGFHFLSSWCNNFLSFFFKTTG